MDAAASPREHSELSQRILAAWHAARPCLRSQPESTVRRKLDGSDLAVSCQFNHEHLANKRPATVSAVPAVVQPVVESAFNFTRVAPVEKLDVLSDVYHNSEHALLVNVSPLCVGHSLLVPYLSARLPQQAAARPPTGPSPLQLALRFSAACSAPDARVGFNSCAAFASVNHWHSHVLFLRDLLPPGAEPLLPLERAARTCLLRVPLSASDMDGTHVAIYDVHGWVIRSLLLRLEQRPAEGTASEGTWIAAAATEVAQAVMADSAAALMRALADADVPHHWLCSAGGAELYIMPRTKQAPSFVVDGSSAMQVALIEACGHGILYEEARYSSLTADDFLAELARFSLGDADVGPGGKWTLALLAATTAAAAPASAAPTSTAAVSVG